MKLRFSNADTVSCRQTLDSDRNKNPLEDTCLLNCTLWMLVGQMDSGVMHDC